MRKRVSKAIKPGPPRKGILAADGLTLTLTFSSKECALFNLLPLPRLLDEWFAWANWAATARGAGEGEYPTGHQEFLWVVEANPELAWKAILSALHDPRGKSHVGVLAAGPLEDLLRLHGLEFIGRVEAEAKADPTFAALLGGVWRHNMSDEVWARLQAVAARAGSP